MFRKICLFIIVASYSIFSIFGMKTLFFYDVESASEMFKRTVIDKNPFMYFSIWGFIFQAVYFLFVLYLEYMESKGEKCDPVKRNKLEAIRKNFFMSTVFPSSMFIGIMFWAVFLYDRELIYPEVLDKEIPPHLNHALHTIPPLLVFLHLLIDDHSGVNDKLCFAVITFIKTFYSICFVCSGVMFGNWVYLMYDTMPTQNIVIIFSISYLISAVSIVIGKRLNNIVPRMRDEVQLAYKKLK